MGSLSINGKVYEITAKAFGKRLITPPAPGKKQRSAAKTKIWQKQNELTLAFFSLLESKKKFAAELATIKYDIFVSVSVQGSVTYKWHQRVYTKHLPFVVTLRLFCMPTALNPVFNNLPSSERTLESSMNRTSPRVGGDMLPQLV